MNYNCNKCNYATNNKSNYTRHMNKKNDCSKDNVKSNVDNNLHEIIKIVVEETVAKQNNYHNGQIIIKPNYSCNECLSEFTRIDSLTRHRKYCKKIKENNDNDLKRALEEIEELKKKINIINNNLPITDDKFKINTNSIIVNDNSINLTNNGTIINNTTINVVPFGKETDKLCKVITNEKCRDIIERGINSITELIMHTHLSKESNLFHNVIITNLKSKTGLIYDGENWVTLDQKDIVETLVDTSDKFLVMKYEEFDKKNKLTQKAKDAFPRYTNKKKTEKEINELKVHYNENIIPMLYDNKDIVNKTKQEMEKQKRLTQ